MVVEKRREGGGARLNGEKGERRMGIELQGEDKSEQRGGGEGRD